MKSNKRTVQRPSLLIVTCYLPALAPSKQTIKSCLAVLVTTLCWFHRTVFWAELWKHHYHKRHRIIHRIQWNRLMLQPLVNGRRILTSSNLTKCTIAMCSINSRQILNKLQAYTFGATIIRAFSISFALIHVRANCIPAHYPRTDRLRIKKCGQRHYGGMSRSTSLRM